MGSIARNFAQASRERLFDRLAAQISIVRANGECSIERKTAWHEIGRLLHEEAGRPYLANEIPIALRAVPWLYVLQKLQEENPDAKIPTAQFCEAVSWHLSDLAAKGA